VLEYPALGEPERIELAERIHSAIEEQGVPLPALSAERIHSALDTMAEHKRLLGYTDSEVAWLKEATKKIGIGFGQTTGQRILSRAFPSPIGKRLGLEKTEPAPAPEADSDPDPDPDPEIPSDPPEPGAPADEREEDREDPPPAVPPTTPTTSPAVPAGAPPGHDVPSAAPPLPVTTPPLPSSNAAIPPPLSFAALKTDDPEKELEGLGIGGPNDGSRSVATPSTVSPPLGKEEAVPGVPIPTAAPVPLAREEPKGIRPAAEARPFTGPAGFGNGHVGPLSREDDGKIDFVGLAEPETPKPKKVWGKPLAKWDGPDQATDLGKIPKVGLISVPKVSPDPIGLSVPTPAVDSVPIPTGIDPLAWIDPPLYAAASRSRVPDGIAGVPPAPVPSAAGDSSPPGMPARLHERMEIEFAIERNRHLKKPYTPAEIAGWYGIPISRVETIRRDLDARSAAPAPTEAISVSASGPPAIPPPRHAEELLPGERLMVSSESGREMAMNEETGRLRWLDPPTGKAPPAKLPLLPLYRRDPIAFGLLVVFLAVAGGVALFGYLVLR